MYEYVRDRKLAIKKYRKIPIDNYIIIYLVDDEKEEIEIRDVFIVERTIRDICK